MTTSHDETAESLDQLLGQVMGEAFDRLVQGDQPDLEALMREHPSIAHLLRRAMPPLMAISDVLSGERPMDVSIDTSRRRQLGDFRIVREIGRGGMGVVYEAEQLSVGRRVALKVLPFASMLDPRALRRFQNEVRAAATLDHPHIVPVYCVGEERGVHYYAMHLIKGRSLAALLHDLRALGRRPEVTTISSMDELVSADKTESSQEGDSSEKAGVTHTCAVSSGAAETDPQVKAATSHAHLAKAYYRSVASLGIQAAEALEHAHAVGIVHRDVKPANLLLDAHGQLFVTDFGLALIESQAETTISGDIVGTLRYMSPEQALGRPALVDYRTDIYSLGATLYELLTLCPAVDGGDRRELLSKIEHEEPVPPRRQNAAVPQELETIVLKCLSKEPSFRYATAQDLADDLRRFLQDEPITARRPTVTTRIAKWSRRHRAAVVSAVAVSTVSLLAITLIAMSQRELEKHARQQADRRLWAQQAISDALTHVVRIRGYSQDHASNEVNWLEARGQAQRALAIAESGLVTPTLLARVRELVSDLDQEGRERQLLAALDAAWLAKADMSDVTFNEHASIPLLREALRAYGITPTEMSSSDGADVITRTSDTVRPKLLAALHEWYILIKPLRGIRTTRRAGETVVESVMPLSTAARDRLVKAGDRLVGIGRGNNGHFTNTSAMTHAEVRCFLYNASSAIERIRVIPLDETEARVYEIAGDPATFWLKAVLDAADSDPWRRRFREACNLEEVTERRLAMEELARQVDVDRQSVRVTVRLSMELVAIGAGDRAIRLLRQVWRKHPGDVEANSALGVLLLQCKPAQSQEAARYLTAAIALRPDSYGLHNNLAAALLDQGNPLAAAAEAREALRFKPDLAYAHNNLGIALDMLGKSGEAVVEYREAVRLQPDNALFHGSLAEALLKQGKPKDAAAVCHEALRLQPNLSQTHKILGSALQDLGQLDDAIAEYRRALELKPDIHVFLLLGNLFYGQGEWDRAIAAYREAVRLRPRDAEAHNNLGLALSELGQLDEAIAVFREGLKLQPNSVLVHNSLGAAFLKLGRPGDAVTEFREALRVDPDNAHAHNNLSWVLANATDENVRDPAGAVKHAKKAVELAPLQWHCHSSLGAAYFRAGEFKAAVRALNRALELNKEGSASIFIFLAMAEAKSGNQEQGRLWYAKAVECMENDERIDAELRRFRDEAERLLDLTKDSPGNPLAAKCPPAPNGTH